MPTLTEDPSTAPVTREGRRASESASSSQSQAYFRIMSLPREIRLQIYQLVFSDHQLSPCRYSGIIGQRLHRPSLVQAMGKNDELCLLAYKERLREMCAKAFRDREVYYDESMKVARQGRLDDGKWQAGLRDADKLAFAAQTWHLVTMREVRRELVKLRADGFEQK